MFGHTFFCGSDFARAIQDIFRIATGVSFASQVSRGVMPRRGWSAIATPSGWFEVIRGPRPPSVKCHLGTKGQGKGKGKPKPVVAVAAPQKVQCQSKVARLEAALQALGQEQSSARSALEEALKRAKEDVPKPMHPEHRAAEASARVGRLEAALKVLGGNDPDAEPLEAALKQARIHARVRPVGERLDLCLQYIARIPRSPETDGGEVEKRVAGLGGSAFRGVRTASIMPPECYTSGDGRGTQRGDHQIAGASGTTPVEATEDADSVRAKKARTSAAESLLVQGGHGNNASDVMLTLIDADDYTLKEAGRVVA